MLTKPFPTETYCYGYGGTDRTARVQEFRPEFRPKKIAYGGTGTLRNAHQPKKSEHFSGHILIWYPYTFVGSFYSLGLLSSQIAS